MDMYFAGGLPPKGVPESKFNIKNDGTFNVDVLKNEFSTRAAGQDYPIYNKEGKVVFNSNIDINKSNFHRTNIGDLKTQLDSQYEVNGILFIKSKALNQLIPLESIILNWKMEKIKSR